MRMAEEIALSRERAVVVGKLKVEIDEMIDACGRAAEIGGRMPGNELRLFRYAKEILRKPEGVLVYSGRDYVAEINIGTDQVVFRSKDAIVEVSA